MPLSCLQLHGTDGSLVTFTFCTQWSCKSLSVRQKVSRQALVSCLQLWPEVAAWGKSTRTSFFLVSSYSVGLPSMKLVSLPSLRMLFPPVTRRSQTFTSCYFSVMPPSPPKSAALQRCPHGFAKYKCITFGNETDWWFSHNGYFGKFFFCTVRMERVTNATIVLGTQSALLFFETDVPRFYRAFTYRLCSRLHTFLKFVQSEQFMPSLKKKKKSPKIGQLKAF